MSLVFDIQRFCVNDGPGIRSTVFFKGCPLTCPWCHNPESNSFEPQLSYQSDRCSSCRTCATVCPHGVHRFSEYGAHLVDFSRCQACGACVAACPEHALKIYGQEMSVEQIMAVLERDAPYYVESGGGVTISGGEPLCSYVKVLSLAYAVKERGWHLCIETSGYGTLRQFKKLSELVDLFLLDYKVTGPGAYDRYIGMPEQMMLDNLAAIDAAGSRVVLRCPIIPGYNDNDGHFKRIGELARYGCVDHVEVLPYHDFGRGKARQIGSDRYLKDEKMPSAELVAEWIARISATCDKLVRKG